MNNADFSESVRAIWKIFFPKKEGTKTVLPTEFGWRGPSSIWAILNFANFEQNFLFLPSQEMWFLGNMLLIAIMKEIIFWCFEP